LYEVQFILVSVTVHKKVVELCICMD